jgi:hypothetical protein
MKIAEITSLHYLFQVSRIPGGYRGRSYGGFGSRMLFRWEIQ